jgi:murein DD-endopeptidase MepM/ murein hydrolase activator NlpD
VFFEKHLKYYTLKEGELLMDDIMFKPRYPRQQIQTRRRPRRNKRTGVNRHLPNMRQKILLQLVICICIMALVGIIKNINTPVTNYCRDKIEYALTYNMEVKQVFNSIGDAIKNAQEGKFFGFDTSEEKQADKDVETSDKDPDRSILEDEDYNASESNTSNGNTSSLLEDSRVEGVNINVEETKSVEEKGTDVGNKEHTFMIPVGGPIESLFGDRTHPIEGEIKPHNGIDIGALNGTPIKAAFDGEVLEAGENDTYGKYIKVSHGKDLITLYAHCSSLLKDKGQSVAKGDIIAKVGNTGLSQGPHLHFEVWKDGKPADPLNYIGR